MTTPRVTVITPVYNRSQRLRDTIDSVLAQQFADFEYLLIDDGSTDDSWEIIREAASRDDRIRPLRKENSGGAATRAQGLGLARGEFVAFLDHDDRWVPEKLALQTEHLVRHADDGWAYGRMELSDEEGGSLGGYAERFGLECPSGWIQERLLIHQNFIGTYSLPLIRAELLRRVGAPRPEAGLSDDWDLFIRLAGAAPVAFIDRVVVRYNHRNPSSQSHNLEEALRSERAVIELHRELFSRLAPEARRRAERNARRRWGRWVKELAWASQRRGDLRAAWRWYRETARMNVGLLLNPASVKDLAALLVRLPRTQAQPR